MDQFQNYHQSNVIHTEETILKYRKGGFHPVCLGDTFQNDRYKIHHKLGWGGSSTVWLAEDRQYVTFEAHAIEVLTDRSRQLRWVSIKILTADATTKSCELSILRSLTKLCEGNPSSKYIVQLLDEFLHQGPNGTHQCLVFELVGPTVYTVTDDYYGYDSDPELTLDPSIILKWAEQVLKAVEFIHEIGYVHGDISSTNVAFTCSHLSRATKEDLFKILGSPESEDLARRDGKPLDISLPKQLVKTAVWDGWMDEDEEDLRVIDFGEAFPQGAEPNKLAQPETLRAPETIFTAEFDYRLDLWRVGIVIYSCVVGGLPFHWWGNMSALVAQMFDFVGDEPIEWQQRWDEMQLASNFTPMERDSDRSVLDERFEGNVTEDSLKPLLAVIQGLMRLMPSQRISVSQALDVVRVSQQMLAEDVDTSD